MSKEAAIALWLTYMWLQLSKANQLSIADNYNKNATKNVNYCVDD